MESDRRGSTGLGAGFLVPAPLVGAALMAEPLVDLDPDLQAELWPPCDMNWEFGGRCEKPAELIVRARCLRGCPPVTRLTCWECCKRMQGLAGYTNCAHGITPIEMLSIERLGGSRV